MILSGFRNPPFLRRVESVGAMMRDMIFVLLALLMIPTLYYGPRVLVTAVFSVASCMAAEILFALFARKDIHFTELSSAVTGLIITMLMPAGISYWAPVTAGIFAVFVAKAPFGGLGRNPFNPAAAGVAFVTLLRPAEMFQYPDMSAGGFLPIFAETADASVSSPAAALRSGFRPGMYPLDMLWGQYAGPIGTTGILVIAACALFLFARRAADWKLTASFLLAAALYAAVFPRVIGSPLTSIKYELMAGSLFFCAVFMVTDPVTSPRTSVGKIIYGALAGILTMILREFGRFEQGACFALLILNACRPLIDRGVCSWMIWKEARHESNERKG